MECRRTMQTQTTTSELANATERTLTESEWVVDGVPVEIVDVTVTNDRVDIHTSAGSFFKSEWHSKMCKGEIVKV